MEPTKSQFQIYSIGIASANKHLDSDDLYVVPIEVTPFGDGELDARLDKYEGGGKDRSGGEYKVKADSDSSVKAGWLRLGHSNRRTPPDVRRGERVMLYRHSNSGDMYWDSMGMDDHLRALETVIYSWSANPDEGANATDPENAYSLEVCTHTKQITLRTTKKNGEPFAYTMQFNTGEGVVGLADDIGNYFELDSGAHCITVENADGSYTRWDKENIETYAPNDVSWDAENNISLSAGVNVSVKAGSLFKLEVGGSVMEVTPGGMDFDSPSYNFK